MLPSGEKAGPFGGISPGQAGDSCHQLARKPLPWFAICLVLEAINEGSQICFDIDDPLTDPEDI